MHHDSIKAMIFYFLKRIDYNKSWEDIEYGMGYDFGDFNFGPNHIRVVDRVRRLAKQNWLELHDFLDENGN